MQLGEVCDLRAGVAFKRELQGVSTGILPFIKVSDMNVPENSISIRSATNWLDDATASLVPSRPFPAGTAVFAKIGEALKQNRVRTLIRPTFIDNNMMGAIPKTSVVDPRFLFYLLRTMDLAQWAIGTALPYLTQTTLSQLPVLVPPLETQTKIAAVLSAYDDLIENNIRRIRHVREMLQRIYREWFVDLRYPGHDEVPVDASRLGVVSKGWVMGTLEDLVVLQRGFDLPSEQRESGCVPVIAATGKHGSHSAAKVSGPGVVTGRSGSLGHVEYVSGDFWPLNTTLWVREFRLATPEFAYYMLQDLDLAQYNSGAAVPTLNRNDIKGLPCWLPPGDLVRSFSDLAKAGLDLQRHYESMNDVAGAARDLLMPRLIAGEFDPAQLEIAVADLAA
jgi:type I restriction enzyme, S subunit